MSRAAPPTAGVASVGPAVPESVDHLGPFVAAGVLDGADVHFAATLATLDGPGLPAPPPEVVLAAALAVRAPRHGSVCVDLDDVAGAARASVEEAHPDPDDDRPAVAALAWPRPDRWVAALAASPLVRDVGRASLDLDGRRPLVLDGRSLYLARHHALEQLLAREVRRRATGAPAVDSGTPTLDLDGADVVSELFAAAHDAGGVDRDQLAAARAGVDGRFVVIVGGPGTGKTTTVARLLAAVAVTDPTRTVALAAPTGKAAARLTEALRGAVAALADGLPPETSAALDALEATTIHRLLGRAGTPWGHGPDRRLPHDLVVVDEASMVSLALMAQLMAAVRDDARIVLVGDPDQLASVEAGTVLADLVAPEATAVAGAVRPLRNVHRQDEGSAILDLAAAVRDGATDEVLAVLRAGGDVTWIDPSVEPGAVESVADDVVAVARAVVTAARAGDVDTALSELGSTRVLCAHRRGPAGVEGWNRRVEDALRALGLVGWSEWYAGRPVMVTENDPLNGVHNGDVGVAVREDDGYAAWFPRGGDALRIDSVRLDRVVTQWSMSIHKSQGSEFDHVVVVLPPAPARILTRELLYTAVTRARRRLTVVASEAAVRAAVDRPVARSSGLVLRLADNLSGGWRLRDVRAP